MESEKIDVVMAAIKPKTGKIKNPNSLSNTSRIAFVHSTLGNKIWIKTMTL